MHKYIENIESKFQKNPSISFFFINFFVLQGVHPISKVKITQKKNKEKPKSCKIYKQTKFSLSKYVGIPFLYKRGANKSDNYRL